MTISLILLVMLVVMALGFDFLNGLHDAANSIATVVATRLMPPVQAVFFAAVFNVAAYWIFGLKIAETVGKGIVDKSIVNPEMIFGALVGAMVWNVITWWKGIPSSSSHALIGGLLGAGIARGGPHAIVWSGVSKTTWAIVFSPVVGLFVSMFLMLITAWIFARLNSGRAESIFRKLHIVSSACYSVGHGANDAQKTMGIIAVLLWSQGLLGAHFYVPGWVVIACYTSMGLGTFIGGWKIIHTKALRC